MPADNLSTATHPRDTTEVSFRTAEVSDAPKIWQLVRDSGVLDLNSRYCYMLLCRDFADTLLVACSGSDIFGFVAAYRPPQNPDVVFVWQVGVAPAARHRGLAKRLLRTLVLLPACRDVRFLEATVTPSNAASRRLFESFAKDLGVPCRVAKGFAAELFGAGEHEEELFRIGPFADSSKERLIT